jgi:hypothetical protein
MQLFSQEKSQTGGTDISKKKSFFHKTNTTHIGSALHYSGFFLFTGLEAAARPVSPHTPPHSMALS